MPRSATTTDAFNAVAEPQRRRILELLAGGEQSVGGIADGLEMNQPQTSKHLRVLKEVGLVRVRGVGKQRLYTLSAEGLKPIHDWVKPFEALWNARFDRLAAHLAKVQAEDVQTEEVQGGEKP